MVPNEDNSWPSLYLIADVATADRFDVDLVEVVADFVEAGGRMVSLRGGECDDERLVESGHKMAASVASVDGIFMVHHRIEPATSIGADGVHLSSRGPTDHQARRLARTSLFEGRSCHDEAEIGKAADDEVDFVTLGPLFESVSKPGYGPGLDASTFRSLADDVDFPVYALGGVVPDNVADGLKAGADGVAVVGGILGAESIREATRRYLGRL